MRVLSQSGLINVPYENTSFNIVHSTIPKDLTVNLEEDLDFGFEIQAIEIQKVMARYRTEEEAYEAMAELHKAFVDYKDLFQFT